MIEILVIALHVLDSDYRTECLKTDPQIGTLQITQTFRGVTRMNYYIIDS
jgi:hypothetical protein